VLASWNRWVNNSEGNGTATLEGVKVVRLSSCLESYRYHLCRNPEEVSEERRRRESLLEALRGRKPGSRNDDRYRRRIAWWRETAENFLGELYSLRYTADNISQRYFDGCEVLFPSKACNFARLVECVEELVEGYNQDFANESAPESGPAQEGIPTAECSAFIDTAALDVAVVPAARQFNEFLVDMARAETLDALGENQAAVTVMDRHV
jgi:hypothetical protein